MIHFDFIVDDIDASNIFECIQAEISKCLMRKLRSNTTPEESDWYDAHAKYLEGLKLKMKNNRVIEEKMEANKFSPKNQKLK